MTSRGPNVSNPALEVTSDNEVIINDYRPG